MSNDKPDRADDDVRAARDTQIADAARRMNEKRREAKAAADARNSMRCDHVIAFWRPFDEDSSSGLSAWDGEDPPDPCWKSWPSELNELNTDNIGNLFGPEDLGEGWCDSCRSRWALHGKVTAANRAHGAAKAALTRMLESDRRKARGAR